MLGILKLIEGVILFTFVWLYILIALDALSTVIIFEKEGGEMNTKYELETRPSARVPIGGVVFIKLYDEYFVLRKRGPISWQDETQSISWEEMYVQIYSTFENNLWAGLDFPLNAAWPVVYTGVILDEYAKEREK